MSPTVFADKEMEMRDESKRVLVFDFLGYSIFVGQNAMANEALVSGHKCDHPNCLWMHVIGRKGPCVVVCKGHAPEVEVDRIVLRYAASRALKLSGIKTGRVLVAPLCDVYKPEQALNGIFRTWRTEFVEL